MKTKHAVAAALTLLLATATQALQRDISDAEMARQSDRIVYGRVASLSYDHSNPAWPVMTQVLLQVENQYKGQPVTSTLFTYPGGVKGGMTMKVSDTPALSVGDEGYFFLYDKAGETLPWLYGWENGAILVEDGQAHSHSFANPGKTAHTLPVDQVETRLQVLLNGGGQ